ncbi:MAG TPA: PLP-dependent aminotransferase family protein [Candidatus Dormibacteraeota bacterium]|nr:PLP-dependent aminotransferase family protein [Candidatus Dormibacteraeota bacterium]
MKPNVLSKLGQRTAVPPISWLMQTALTRPRLISLAAGFTDNSTLPVGISRKLLNDILRSPKTGRPALQYGITAGETNLRALTAKHLQKLDGGHDRAHSPERVIITGGSQQLLYMTLEALCDEGDIILVEDPTYFVFLSILQSRGIKARGVKLERDGIDLVHLEKVLERLKKSGELRRVKALYLVTYFQNPTGVTTTLAKKSAALKLLKKFERAAGHPLYLLEDAAYRELSFASTPSPRPSGERAGVRGFEFETNVPPTALTLPGAAERVIYTGTYSKPYAPGARVGFGILPEPLFTTVQRIKGNHDFGTANLLQQLLARALATGFYDRHVAKVQKNYARKARVMKRALAEHFPANVEIWESGGGLYFWARLPKHISAGVKSKVFQTALKNDVLYVPGELCYAEDPSRAKPDNEMRISFGSANVENIRKGIARLGAVLKKFL